MRRHSYTVTAILCAAMLCTPSLLAQETPRKDNILQNLKLPKLRKKKRTRKQIEQAEFKLVKGDGRIYFSLSVGDEILLRSPGYATERAVNEAMQSVITHIKRVRDMPMRQLDTGEHYFVVITRDDNVLASSPLYSSKTEARTMRARLKEVSIPKQDQ